MKEKDKTSEEQPSELEAGKLSEKEFRVMRVKMIQDLRKRMEAQFENMQEIFDEDVEKL